MVSTNVEAFAMAADDHNQRTGQRRRVLKGAKIIFRGGFSTINCVVRDHSETGARLQVDTIVGIPDSFRLQILDAPPRDCRVVWRSARELGITFEISG